MTKRLNPSNAPFKSRFGFSSTFMLFYSRGSYKALKHKVCVASLRYKTPRQRRKAQKRKPWPQRVFRCPPICPWRGRGKKKKTGPLPLLKFLWSWRGITRSLSVYRRWFLGGSRKSAQCGRVRFSLKILLSDDPKVVFFGFVWWVWKEIVNDCYYMVIENQACINFWVLAHLGIWQCK